MDYFEFMGLSVSFYPDEAALRQRYYKNSRAFHPDFFTLASDEKREWAMEQSTLNNAAFATLSDAGQCMAYLLRLKGLLGEDGQPQPSLPQDFLMDMMDINESIMELQFDFDEARYQQALVAVNTLEQELSQEVSPLMKNYVNDGQNEADLEKIKNFYLKKKYLLRVRENLSTFAPA